MIDHTMCWTPADAMASMENGWQLVDPTLPTCRIARNPGLPRFFSDLDAERFVRQKALDGIPLAIKAKRFAERQLVPVDAEQLIERMAQSSLYEVVPGHSFIVVRRPAAKLDYALSEDLCTLVYSQMAAEHPQPSADSGYWKLLRPDTLHRIPTI